MTLEDKLLDRLEKLAGLNGRLTQSLNHSFKVIGDANKDNYAMKTRLDQVESAHTQLLKYTKELESKLSRKGKNR
jgi:hypothetical protein